MLPEAVPSVIPKINPELLPILDEYEMAFVLNVCRGMTMKAAYLDAYAKARHVGGHKTNSSTKAHLLSLRPNVAAWMSAMREAQAYVFIQTAEQYAAEVRAVMEQCRRIGDMRGAVKALELLGRTEGHFDKTMVSVEQTEDGDLIKRIEVQLGPNAAAAAKKRLGLDGGAAAPELEAAE